MSDWRYLELHRVFLGAGSGILSGAAALGLMETRFPESPSSIKIIFAAALGLTATYGSMKMSLDN